MPILNVPLHNVDVFPPRAIPTNEWWGNWLNWNGDSNPESESIFSNPYTYRIVAGRGLSVSYLYPYQHTDCDAQGNMLAYD